MTVVLLYIIRRVRTLTNHIATHTLASLCKDKELTIPMLNPMYTSAAGNLCYANWPLRPDRRTNKVF